MSRYTDEDLRAAFRLRAAGGPRPGLYLRIRQSTRPASELRSASAIRGVAHPRPTLAHLTASAAVAAVLILAPVVVGGLDMQRLELISDSGRPDQTAASVVGAAATDGDNDDEADDVGDDEDGIDEDDEADDEADDDVGDDEVDPEEPEDDN